MGGRLAPAARPTMAVDACLEATHRRTAIGGPASLFAEEVPQVSLLLVAIVHDSDADRVVTGLSAAGHRSTRIPSIGGFLGASNTTLLVGLEESQEAAVLAVFELECSGREVELPLVMLERLKDADSRVVRYGGATIFVVDLRRIIRI